MAEESKEKLKIRLHVYDTEIAVNVVRDDEEYYRKAAKLITDTVSCLLKKIHYLRLMIRLRSQRYVNMSIRMYPKR